MRLFFDGGFGGWLCSSICLGRGWWACHGVYIGICFAPFFPFLDIVCWTTIRLSRVFQFITSLDLYSDQAYELVFSFSLSVFRSN